MNPVVTGRLGIEPQRAETSPLNMGLEELRVLDSLLGRHGAILHVKYHFYEEPRVEAEKGYFERLSNIRPLRLPVTREHDPYDYLSAFDVLVTDYSSIFYDYLLLDRPIVFYAFDKGRPMRLVVDWEAYDDFVPGPVAVKPAELVEVFRVILGGGDPRAERRRELRRIVHRYIDDGSSGRVWRVAEELLGV